MATVFTSSIAIAEGVLPSDKLFLDSNKAGLIIMSNNSANQMWKFLQPSANKVLLFNIIKNSGSGEGKALNCTSDGQVSLHDQDGTTNQQWQLTEHGTFYTIQNIHGTSDGLKFLGCKQNGDIAMFKDGKETNEKWMIKNLKLDA